MKLYNEMANFPLLKYTFSMGVFHTASIKPSKWIEISKNLAYFLDEVKKFKSNKHQPNKHTAMQTPIVLFADLRVPKNILSSFLNII